MAFESAIIGAAPMGNKRMVWGTFTNGGSDSGGNINTGLRICEQMFLQHGDTNVVASAPVVNESLPVDGLAVTVVTVTGADGYWLAFGV